METAASSARDRAARRIRQHDDALRRRRFLLRIAIAAADAIEPVQRRRAEHDRAHVPLDHARIELPFVAGDLGRFARSVRKLDVDRDSVAARAGAYRARRRAPRPRADDSRAARCRRATPITASSTNTSDQRLRWHAAKPPPRAPVPPRAGAVADRDQRAQDREPVESDQECASTACRKHSRSAAPPRGYTVGADQAAFASVATAPVRVRSAGRSPCAHPTPGFRSADARADACRVRQQGRARQAESVRRRCRRQTRRSRRRRDAGGRRHAPPPQDSGRTLRPPCAWVFASARCTVSATISSSSIAATRPLALDTAAIRPLGDRHFGVGFDQLLTIERARDASLRVRLRHLEHRRLARAASAATACAASRAGSCAMARLPRRASVGWKARRDRSRSSLLDDGRVRADMGEPRFAPAEIPLVGRGRAGSLPDRCRRQRNRSGRGIDGQSARGGRGRRCRRCAGRGARAADRACACVSGALQRRFRAACARAPRSACASGSAASARRSPAAAAPARRSRCCVGAATSTTRSPSRCPAATLEIAGRGPGATLWMTGPATFVFEGEWHG